MEHQAELRETIRWQRAGMAGGGSLASPFYFTLCDGLALDLEQDGPATRVLAPFAAAPFEAAYVLRLLGGLHRLVLSGEAPELARHYPSVGGDGDGEAAVAAIQELLIDPPPAVLDALTRPPQTNEVARSVALASGLLVVAQETGRPLSVREIGTSGGLNLRPDSYWFEQGGAGWGDPTSPVRFVDLWRDGTPPFGAGLEISSRRGCDRDPIDATSPDGALTLLSYVWPEPAERFERARAAITLAGRTPVRIDRADAASWVGEQLQDRRPGTALVVYHSVMWQYLDAPTQAAVRDQLDEAGRAATPDAPLAWLRLEPNPATYVPAELRLTLWAGRSSASTRAAAGHHRLPRRPDRLGPAPERERLSAPTAPTDAPGPGLGSPRVYSSRRGGRTRVGCDLTTRAVLIDLYDTLVSCDFLPLHEVVAEHLDVPLETVQAAYDATRPARGTGEYPSPAAALSFIAARCGRDVAPAVLARLVAAEHDFLAGGVRLYPDSLDTIRALRAAGIRTGLESNCSPATGAVIERLGLRSELDAVVVSFEVGALKPDPTIFLAALERLDAAASDTWFLDDQAGYCDGARRLGIRTVQIVRGGPAPAGGRGTQPRAASLTAARRHLLSEDPAGGPAARRPGPRSDGDPGGR